MYDLDDGRNDCDENDAHRDGDGVEKKNFFFKTNQRQTRKTEKK